MGVIYWLGERWFTLIQTACIVAGLLFTAISLRIDAKARRVSNLIAITREHRDIWTQLYKRPELWRVLERFPDLANAPISAEQQMFINFIILHLASVYEAMENSMFFQIPSLGKDLKHFFSLPIPRIVWDRMKSLQSAKFVAFVEALAQLKVEK